MESFKDVKLEKKSDKKKVEEKQEVKDKDVRKVKKSRFSKALS